MNKGITAVFFTLFAAIILFICLWANSDTKVVEARDRADAMEALYHQYQEKYNDAAYDLARCRGSVKVVTQTRVITKKVPGSWWLAEQDTIRDTIYTVPDSVRTWLWEGN